MSSSEKDLMAQINELNRQLQKERMKRAKEKKQKEAVRCLANNAPHPTCHCCDSLQQLTCAYHDSPTLERIFTLIVGIEEIAAYRGR